MTVIYNDTCPICSREVDVYRRDAAAAGCAVEFDGLEAADLAGLGLDREAAARRFHVVREGELLSGLDAFLALWAALPRWTRLARAIDRPLVRPVARVVYDRIAAPVLYAMDRRRRRRHGRHAQAIPSISRPEVGAAACARGAALSGLAPCSPSSTNSTPRSSP